MEEITTATENKEYAVGVFLDLRKAFDTVDHHLLLMKLQKYGIRGVGLSWLSSYLENRSQYVQINQVKSQLLKVESGIPQGSVLGPLLFILCINNICEVSRTLKTILFADDTNVLCCGDTLEQLLDTVGNELKILKSWFDSN